VSKTCLSVVEDQCNQRYLGLAFFRHHELVLLIPKPHIHFQSSTSFISDSQRSQESDEKILYQAADHNPARAKEPHTDNKPEEMSGRGQKPSLFFFDKISSQRSRMENGDVGEKHTVEDFYALKEKLVESQKRLGNAESLVSKLQAENKKLSEKIAEVDRAFQKDPGSRCETQKATTSKELEGANKWKDERIKELEKQLSQMQRLFEIKAAELVEAQAYASKPDDISGSDVIGMVKLLNSEIFNTAKAISGLFERNKKADYDETFDKWEFFNDCMDIAKEYIGEKLYEYNCQVDGSMDLRNPINPQDWIPLELALQCILVGWCSYVAGTIGPVPGDGEALQRCYENIRVRGE